MGQIEALRVLNSVVSGDTDSTELEALLGNTNKLGEWHGLMGNRLLVQRIVESDIAFNTVAKSSKALKPMVSSFVSSSAIIGNSNKLSSLFQQYRNYFLSALDTNISGNLNFLAYYRWLLRTSGFGTTSIYGVTYGNGLYVAVGDSGKLVTSPDGITWTLRTSGFGTTHIYGVTYGNGLYVAVGDGGKLVTSI